MANFVRDFLRDHPELAARPLFKRERHSLHFDMGTNPDGSHNIIAPHTGGPIHYEAAPGDWRELDTDIQDLGDFWGAPGLPARIRKSDRLVEIINSLYAHRTTRVGVLRPSTMALRGTPINIPIGTPQGDSVVASGTIGGSAWSHTTTLIEDGAREAIVLQAKPTISGVTGTDRLILETVVNGVTFPDGMLDEFDVDGMHFALPRAWDAAGNEADCKRYAKTISGTQYVYTGIPVAWLATAQYPVTVDPDFNGDTADGFITGTSTVYATARSTTTASDVTATTITVGQRFGTPNYDVNRGALKFPTSAIGAGATVTQVNLAMSCVQDWGRNSFNCEIVKLDWSAQDPIGAGNREAAFDNCLSATADDAILSAFNYAQDGLRKTSGNLSTSWVNLTGNTYYGLRSNRDVAGTTPTQQEYVTLASQNHATTAKRPVLTVAYTTGATYTRTASQTAAVSQTGITRTAAQTATLSALTTSTRTASQSANLSQTGITRTALQSVTVSQPGITRTALQSVALTQTLTRTATQSASLKATVTRTAVQSATLQSTVTRSAVQSAALKSTLERVAVQSATIARTLERTASQTTALKATLTRTAIQTAAISGGLTRTALQSATISQALTRTAMQSAALSATLTRTAIQRANLVVPQTYTRTAAQSVALSQAGIIRTAGQSAAVVATLTRTAVQTAAISGGLVRTAIQSVALKQLGITRTATQSAALSQTLTRTATQSGAISKSATRTAVQSAALSFTSTRSATQSASLKQTLTRAALQSTAIVQTLTRTAVQSVTLEVVTSQERTAVQSAALLATVERTAVQGAALLSTTTLTALQSATLYRAISMEPVWTVYVRSRDLTLTTQERDLTATVKPRDLTLEVHR